MNAPRLFGLPLLGSGVLLAVACGGAPVEIGPAAPGTVPSGAPVRPTPKTRIDELASAPAYDAAGHAAACAPPSAACPQVAPDRAFLDRCRLAGFQIRTCGCDQRCSGDVTAAQRHYDDTGAPKECAPARPDCTPPPAGASFQDACSEKGYRLDVCGCEWLCSGNPRK